MISMTFTVATAKTDESIQKNSGLSQGLSPRLAPQSTTRAVGILMPLWSRSEQIKVQAIPGLIGQYGDVP